MHQRPLRDVPWPLRLALPVLLALYIGWGLQRDAVQAQAEALPAPPGINELRLFSLGEPVALGKLLMLYIQAFDYRAGSDVPYRKLDYTRLIEWLDRILALDPRGQYPLMSASRLYAEVPDAQRSRLMLDFIYRQYLRDPNRRWPWMAHATLIAKHRLHDLPLALEYATALQTHTTTPDAPLWVKQMRAFILEDMNELEAARIVIGGILDSGQVKDERDYQLLHRRLDALESKMKAQSTAPSVQTH
jgi:hypothetical protein